MYNGGPGTVTMREQLDKVSVPTLVVYGADTTTLYAILPCFFLPLLSYSHAEY